MDMGVLGGLWASGLREGRTAGGHGQGLPRSPGLQVRKGTQCRREHIYGFLSMLGAQGDGEGMRAWGAATPVSPPPSGGDPASRNSEPPP